MTSTGQLRVRVRTQSVGMRKFQDTHASYGNEPPTNQVLSLQAPYRPAATVDLPLTPPVALTSLPSSHKAVRKSVVQLHARHNHHIT